MAKKFTHTTSTRLRRYTPREQQLIRSLAEILGKSMPATSQGHYCLKKKAKDIGCSKFFNDKLPNKKEQFAFFIKQMYGRHPIKFKKFINDNLAESVEWRRNKGNPILKNEVEEVKSILLELKIDLGKEIDGLNLPIERPRITPPSIDIKNTLNKFGLHPLFVDKVIPLFNDGHLNEAVRKSGEIFETQIKKHYPSLGKSIYGRDLVTTVFSVKNPLCKIEGYHNSQILNPVDEREGYLYLSMGAMHWCKNITGHGDINQLSPIDAVSRIILVSHLLEIFENRLSYSKTNPK